MTNRLRYASLLYASFIAIAFIAGCSAATEPVVVTVIDNIPRTIGTTWTYDVYDSLTSRSDTAVVSIVESAHLALRGQHVMGTRWQIRQANDTQDVYVYRIDSTIYMEPAADAHVLFRQLKFPMRVGDAWAIDGGQDSVVASSDVAIEGAAKKEFTVTESWDNGFTVFGHSAMRVVPGIGITRLEAYEASELVVLRNEVWMLRSFD